MKEEWGWSGREIGSDSGGGEVAGVWRRGGDAALYPGAVRAIG